MGFIILGLWDWCCKSKGFRERSEYDLINVFETSWKRIKLSLKQFEHHTQQLTVVNPSFFNRNRKEEQRDANNDFAKWRVKCFYDSLVKSSSLVFQLNICAENPPLRKAENRSQF